MSFLLFSLDAFMKVLPKSSTLTKRLDDSWLVRLMDKNFYNSISLASATGFSYISDATKNRTAAPDAYVLSSLAFSHDASSEAVLRKSEFLHATLRRDTAACLFRNRQVATELFGSAAAWGLEIHLARYHITEVQLPNGTPAHRLALYARYVIFTFALVVFDRMVLLANAITALSPLFGSPSSTKVPALFKVNSAVRNFNGAMKNYRLAYSEWLEFFPGDAFVTFPVPQIEPERVCPDVEFLPVSASDLEQLQKLEGGNACFLLSFFLACLLSLAFFPHLCYRRQRRLTAVFIYSSAVNRGVNSVIFPYLCSFL